MSTVTRADALDGQAPEVFTLHRPATVDPLVLCLALIALGESVGLQFPGFAIASSNGGQVAVLVGAGVTLGGRVEPAQQVACPEPAVRAERRAQMGSADPSVSAR